MVLAIGSFELIPPVGGFPETVRHPLESPYRTRYAPVKSKYPIIIYAKKTTNRFAIGGITEKLWAPKDGFVSAVWVINGVPIVLP